MEPIPKPTPLIRPVYGPIFGWSLLESGVGLNDPCRSLPTRDILGFYDSVPGSCGTSSTSMQLPVTLRHTGEDTCPI